MIYYKNPVVQTKEKVEQLLSDMDKFVSTGIGGQPRLDQELTKIWNKGNGHLPWEWSEESQQEINNREQQEQSKADQIEAYKNDLELWKNKKVRPIRNVLMSQWVDHFASKPLWWSDLISNNPDMIAEILVTRQVLLDWPATFTEYVTDQSIESKKPVKPSYITG